MSTATSHRAGMRAFDWLVLVAACGSSRRWRSPTKAMRRNPEPQPAPQAMASGGGTRDAKTWFTDTVLKDQNGRELRFTVTCSRTRW